MYISIFVLKAKSLHKIIETSKGYVFSLYCFQSYQTPWNKKITNDIHNNFLVWVIFISSFTIKLKKNLKYIRVDSPYNGIRIMTLVVWDSIMILMTNIFH